MTRHLRQFGFPAALAAALVATLVAVASAGPAAAQNGDLVGMLTSQLGVSEEQAAGGAGSLFGFAKGQMTPGDFDAVASALPEVDGLMGAAPAGGSGLLGSSSSLLGGSSLGGSSLGGSAGGLGDMAGVASSFSDLGMSPDMVNEFVPVILDYAQSAGGEQTMQLLKGAFSAL
jgi:hypothetical protein